MGINNPKKLYIYRGKVYDATRGVESGPFRLETQATSTTEAQRNFIWQLKSNPIYGFNKYSKIYLVEKIIGEDEVPHLSNFNSDLKDRVNTLSILILELKEKGDLLGLQEALWELDEILKALDEDD